MSARRDAPGNVCPARRLPPSFRGPVLAVLLAAASCGAAVAADAADAPGAPGAYGAPRLSNAAPAAAAPVPAAHPAAPRGRALRFETATFDPLADGEPDLSPDVPERPEYAAPAADAKRLGLVQFDVAPGAEQRAALLAADLVPLLYVPDDAYLVRGDGVALARAANLPHVRWAGRYRPGYKVTRGLVDLAAGRPPRHALPGEAPVGQVVDLLLAPGADAAAVLADVRTRVPASAVLATSEGSDPGLITVRLAHHGLAAQLADLANLDDVMTVTPHGEIVLHNDDAAWIGQTYDRVNRQNYSKTATVWNHALLGEGEVIGIADTGVDPDVCWMYDPLGLPVTSAVPATGLNRGPIPVDNARRKIIGYNLLGTFQATATAYDVHTAGVDPHGTWCAVSALGDNPAFTTTESNPTAKHHDVGDGMAPLAKLVVEDLGDTSGKLVGLGLPLPTIIDQMFEQERDAGVRVSTNSWGVDGNQYDTLAFFADRMVWNHPDFVLVFSAGNAGPYPKSLASPGTAKNVITVGASEDRPSTNPVLDPENVAEFSARGPTSDGRLKPDVSMSGKSVVSGTSDRAETGQTCATATINGTSFSAPVVAGYAALVREYYRKGYFPTGTRRAADGFLPSAALVKATLVAGARNMTGKAGASYAPCVLDTCALSAGLCNASLAPCNQDADCYYCNGNARLSCTTNRDCDLSQIADSAPSTDQGWGRLMLEDALYFSGDTRGAYAWDVARDQGVATGETWSREVYLDGRTEDLQVVLTWTDPPSLIASPSYLVNNLDLHVVDPTGKEYWGNAFAARDRNPLTVEYSVQNAHPANDVDNVELVRLPYSGAPAGNWKIEVVGKSVPGSPWIDGGARQDFAVVAVGPVAANGGTVRFTRSRFSCSGSVSVEVIDQNAAAPLSVVVTTGSGDQETVALAAQGGGRFTGSVPVASGLPLAAGDGQLEVADHDPLTATYSDANPARTATARAQAECGASVLAGSAQITGGCDGDSFLDAGEQVSLKVPLTNPGPLDLKSVTARLVGSDARLYVTGGSVSYGDIASGAGATPGAAWLVALRPGATPRSTATLSLVVSAAGWTEPVVLPVTLTLEADQVHTLGTWSDDFTTSLAECNDGSHSPTAGSWYWLHPDKNCGSSAATWNVGNCLGSRQALLPSCSGQLLGVPSLRDHRLVSPEIVTGAAGSVTLFKRLRFKESYHAKLNVDGKPCDRMEVLAFTNRDGRTSPTGYYRDQTAVDATDVTADLDPTTMADWTLPPLPDATTLQLIFHLALHDPQGGSTVCGSSVGDEIRWRVDNVLLDYENVSTVNDATSCTPACSAPSVPGGMTVTPLGGGRVVVGWDPVPGAHHYDVYRRTASGDVFLGRTSAPDSAFVTTPGDAPPYTYVVAAVESTGLCASAPSAPASWTGTLDCSAAPPAPAAVTASDAAVGTCRADVTWSAVSAPCGGAVTYRVYRSTDASFAAGPATLVAETSATSWADLALTTGWDSRGEPLGDEWTYEVRAVDAAGREGAGMRAAVRAGGPRATGTWLDDGGDARPSKMTAVTTYDENNVGAKWSRSPLAAHHGGGWSYWSDKDPLGTGNYPALSCMGLVSPPVRLAAAPAPQLAAWFDYQIETNWDGVVVEVAPAGGAFVPVSPAGGYPGSFSNTTAPPCVGGGGTGQWINGCQYPPTQGAITGPAIGGVSGWVQYTFNLAPWAGQTVQFRLNMSSDCGTTGGVVVDDLSITNAVLSSACTSGACLPAPQFSGLVSALDLDPNATTGVHLTWGAPTSWGGGGTGTFEVWRDGARIATLAAAARAYDDIAAEPNVDHAYQVIARSGGSCLLPSSTSASITARDCGPLDAVVREAAHLDVQRSPALVILRASALAGAATYRFRWSHLPNAVAGSPDTLQSAVPETRHDVLNDGLNYFYLVEDGPAAGCP